MSFIPVLLSLGSVSVDTRPLLSTLDVNIVFDGDSLTEGVSWSGISQYFPKQVQAFLTGKVKTLEFHSFGVSGQDTQNMLSDIGTQILTLVNPSKENIIVVWEDVNAILNSGRTAAQNKADFENYLGQCKTAGFDKAILLTGYYPRKKIDGTYNQTIWASGSPSRLDVQHDYFELCKNEGVIGADKIVDLRLNSVIGGARNQQLANTDIFGDSVHLESGGYDQVVEEVIAALRTFYVF